MTNVKSFDIVLTDTALRNGVVEGYTESGAWYLDIGNEEGAQAIYALRADILQSLNIEPREKIIHVTLASKLRTAEQEEMVSFTEEFKTIIPVSEVVLMEVVAGKSARTYRSHSVFALSK